MLFVLSDEQKLHTRGDISMGHTVNISYYDEIKSSVLVF